MDCKESYCSRCSVHLEPRPRLCHTCLRFYGNLLQRAELMKLKVKELRDYLHLHQVSTHLCREKEELVELVLGHQSSSSEASTPDLEPSLLTTPTYTEAPPMANQALPTQTEAPSPPTETTHPESEAPPPDSEPVQTDSPQEEEEDEEQSPGEVPRRRASLSDIRSEQDIEHLSVRRLKEILARNFVDYKGCCEKWELMERVRRLYHDKLHLAASSNTSTEDESGLCRICMDAHIDCVLLECGHMITCTNCGKRMSECPICRQYVIRAVHVFRS